jgi:hypothetical protein
MDQETAKRFNALLKEEPGSLSEHDLGFLRARASYLNADERKRFAGVLGEKPEPADEDESKDEEPTAPKKKK